MAARFVCEQLVGLEVTNRAFEFINDPLPDSAISEGNIHRSIERSRAPSPLQTRGGPKIAHPKIRSTISSAWKGG